MICALRYSDCDNDSTHGTIGLFIKVELQCVVTIGLITVCITYPVTAFVYHNHVAQSAAIKTGSFLVWCITCLFPVYLAHRYRQRQRHISMAVEHAQSLAQLLAIKEGFRSFEQFCAAELNSYAQHIDTHAHHSHPTVTITTVATACPTAATHGRCPIHICVLQMIVNGMVIASRWRSIFVHAIIRITMHEWRHLCDNKMSVPKHTTLLLPLPYHVVTPSFMPSAHTHTPCCLHRFTIMWIPAVRVPRGM